MVYSHNEIVIKMNQSLSEKNFRTLYGLDSMYNIHVCLHITEICIHMQKYCILKILTMFTSRKQDGVKRTGRFISLINVLLFVLKSKC